MNLCDVLIMSANLLNLNDESQALSTMDQDNVAEIVAQYPKINKLFNLAQTALREICFSYLPLVVEADVEFIDGTYSTDQLDGYVKLVKVKKDGYVVHSKFKNGKIIVKNPGVYTVMYVQKPKVYSLLDNLDIFENLSPDILVLGTCAYYAISLAMYDDFEYFHDEYIKRAESIKKLAMAQMPTRRWV